MMQDFAGENIWIIGASSGIGRALAAELAGRGARLVLSARREAELQALSGELAGAGHWVLPLDAGNEAAIATACRSAWAQCGRIDRVIFMAAAFKPVFEENSTPQSIRQIVEVNLLGGLWLGHHAVPLLAAQISGGQLVLCASVAGYTGMPGGQPYSATKAGLINYAESLYAELPPRVNVKLINPGFVRTRITAKNPFPMPFIIAPEEAAKAIARGLKGRAFEIHFPRRFTFLMKILHSLPYAIRLPLIRLAAKRV